VRWIFYICQLNFLLIQLAFAQLLFMPYMCVWMQPAPWMKEHGKMLLENYCRAGLATDDNMVNVHYMLDT
jgi:hypothetical protein